jgi:tRNA 5-methylaminomethyl-2-thiouridine biosynthesis bifunctional protein
VRWCTALLDHPNVCVHLATAAESASFDNGWTLGVGGGRRFEASILIAANAFDAPRLLGLSALLKAVRGRVTHLDPAPFAALAAPIAGDGTLLRAPDDTVSIGATYETPLDIDPDVGALDDARATASNLARLARLLAHAPPAASIGTFDGRRCVARDRLPLAGSAPDETLAFREAERLRGAHFEDLPRRAGLYGCFALGSRGLTLAALLAELIACRIEGEPLPVERALAAAVDPARFLLRSLRACRAHALQPPQSTRHH